MARQLLLDYGCLKRRMTEMPAPKALETKATTDFLEFLAMPAPLSEMIQSCSIRLRTPRADVRIELQRLSPQALGTILKEALG